MRIVMTMMKTEEEITTHVVIHPQNRRHPPPLLKQPHHMSAHAIVICQRIGTNLHAETRGSRCVAPTATAAAKKTVKIKNFICY